MSKTFNDGRFNEIVDDIFEKISQQSDANELFGCKKHDLILFHDNLGRQIRNRYDLWKYEWKEEIVSGVDVSPNHPDQISQRIIEAVWKKGQS